MIQNIEQPIAKTEDTVLELFSDKRVDPYYWMKEKDTEEVLDYLKAENKYYHQVTEKVRTLEDDIYHEMRSRIKEDDDSVPVYSNGYWYITHYKTGQEYPIFIRKKKQLSATEEILLDGNEMAKEHSYFEVSDIDISPNNKLAVIGIDTLGRRMYTLKIKNLKTGEFFEETIENTSGNACWGNDNKTIYYTKKNPVTLRHEKIYKHTINSNPKEDELIYHEKDETFYVNVYRSKSDKYLFIASLSTLTTEYRYLPTKSLTSDFKVFQERISGIEYDIEHANDHFYIKTNIDGADNFKLMLTRENKTTRENWQNLIEYRPDVLIEDFEVFRDYLAISERHKGLSQINIRSWDHKSNYHLPLEGETYTASLFDNKDFNLSTLRYYYSSMTTPGTVIDFNMKTQDKVIKKTDQVLGGDFDSKNYDSERIWATSRDGINKIPISMVYKKGIKRDGHNPLLIYAYGSYGYTIDPKFSSIRLSLLDRGFVFAIAHVRGGEYLGRQWYENGKLLNKLNTFFDFIDATKYLQEKKYTSHKHCYAMGGSAGGLLMGGVLNMAPHLYNAIISAVPFVDVLTTMLDDTIPLTTSEYDEWGNPNKEEYYRYIKQYSPYDNVSKINYPHILVTTGYHDSQVQYWEPSKWVAKLRANKTDNNILLYQINMDSGHSGASGRFEWLKEVAKEYAFIVGIEHKKLVAKN